MVVSLYYWFCEQFGSVGSTTCAASAIVGGDPYVSAVFSGVIISLSGRSVYIVYDGRFYLPVVASASNRACRGVDFVSLVAISTYPTVTTVRLSPYILQHYMVKFAYGLGGGGGSSPRLRILIAAMLDFTSSIVGDYCLLVKTNNSIFSYIM